MTQDFEGTIIEESLVRKGFLKKLSHLQTRVEQVTERHQTPWLLQWTLQSVAIPAQQVLEVANEICKSIDPEHAHAWYVDFNNGVDYFVIFRNAIFSWQKGDQDAVKRAKSYGRLIGVPEHQLDFPG